MTECVMIEAMVLALCTLHHAANCLVSRVSLHKEGESLVHFTMRMI